MNHYFNNIVARSLHLTDVILPRLASRFEPVPHHILPGQRSFQGSMSGDDGSLKALDQYDRDQDASNHYASDHYAKVTAKKIVRSSPVLATEVPDLSGQSYAEIPASLEAVRMTPLSLEGTKSDRSLISESSGTVSPHQTTPEPRIVQKVIEKARSEHQPSLEEPMLFTPVEEKQILREPSDEKKPIRRRTLEMGQPDKIVPLAYVEEEQVSIEQKPNRKALIRPASENMWPEEEIVPLALFEENEKRRVAEYGIRHRTGVPNTSINPLISSVSQGMVVAQPYVKSYFRRKRDEILDESAKPETAAPVQVTIGRIEIRATPATATPQRKRAEPPIMSLEDYLKIKRGSL